MDVTELAQAVKDDEKALAAADLAILQKFAQEIGSGAFTVPDFTKAFSALSDQLGDPGRKAQAKNFFEQFEATLGLFGQLIEATERDAT